MLKYDSVTPNCFNFKKAIYKNLGMKKLLVVIIFSFSTFILFSQHIEGKVLDVTTKDPIAGVNVYLKGCKTGTFTDENGNYYLKVSFKNLKTDTIQFSHISYKKLQIPFKKNTSLYSVYLIPDSNNLSEIEISKKKNLKSSIAFKKISTMKIGLHDFGSVLNNNKIYVLGGDFSYEEDGLRKRMENNPDMSFDELIGRKIIGVNFWRYSNKLLIYDIKNNTWEKSNLKLRKRAYGNSNFYENKIYNFGGKNISNNGKFEYLDDKIEIIDIDKETVTIDNTNPHQAVNFASFTYKDNIIVIGGSIKLKNNNLKEYTNKVHLYNIKTGLWYELATMPVEKEVNGVLINDKIYLVGGFNGKPLNSIETYNITNGKWKKEGELFEGMERPAITKNNDLIYIFDDGKIYTYNIKTKELNEYFIDLYKKAAHLYYANNKLYILGGYNYTNYSVTPATELYTIDLNEFNLTKVINSKTL